MAIEVWVLPTNGCLDMDTKSKLCPAFVMALSNLCQCTESVQSLSKSGPNSVNPLQIFEENGQSLDFKIQHLSRFCPNKKALRNFLTKQSIGSFLHI